MSRQQVAFTTPTGRVVQGDLYTPNEKDQAGRPLKDQQGNPKKQFFFALAIAKTAGDAQPVQTQAGVFPGWITTEWGKVIWNEAFGARPCPSDPMPRDTRFAFKVVDGDSTEMGGGTPPKRICDYEGFAGHWIIKFTSGFPFNTYQYDSRTDQFSPLPEGAIKRGFYVQVRAGVVHNENTMKPGVYMNCSQILLVAYGKEIAGATVDPRSAGFNPTSALPAGASAVPPAALAVGATPTGVPAGAPLPLPGAAAVAPGVPTMPGVAAPYAAPPVTYVTPNPGIMPQVPVPGAAPMVPLPSAAVPAAPGVPGMGGAPVLNVPPPPPAAPVLTAKAGGATYQQMLANGWNDALLRQHGYLA